MCIAIIPRSIIVPAFFSYIVYYSYNDALVAVNSIFSSSGFGDGPNYGSCNGFYNCGDTFGDNPISDANNPYQTVGGGSYYLADSTFREVGTTNIDGAAQSEGLLYFEAATNVLADLAMKTTWPPTEYRDQGIVPHTTLSPTVRRDTNSSPDLGYHYDSLDYILGGCAVYSDLTVTNGAAIGWYLSSGLTYLSGRPYAVALIDGANLSFKGNATQLCYFANFLMVQEGGNGNGTDRGDLGGIVFSGSTNSTSPQLSANFTKWTVDAVGPALCDDWSNGVAFLRNCEFYNAGISSHDLKLLNFTNCLFFRDCFTFLGDTNNHAGSSLTFENCTFFDGGLSMNRYSGAPSTFWLVENTTFDGTAFEWNDNYNGSTNHTLFNYNAYNTNNFSWKNYPFLSWTNGFLETNGSGTVKVTNYNWQSSWFGNFYLPSDSLLITNGSTTAIPLGLYHFTTQTNQIPDGTNIVTIGYHYVATDANGNPLSTPNDGTPDYLADANGNGIDDTNETPWNIGFISEPQSTNVAQGQNVTFTTTVGGIGPFTYQWLSNSTPIAGAIFFSYTNLVVPASDDGNAYSVIVSNLDGHITSTSAILWVSTPVVLSGGPNDQTVTNGGSASFSITNSSGTHLNYQWFYYPSDTPIGNSSRIGGVTSSNLTISAVQVSDATNCYVVVSNVFNSVGSGIAALIVITNPVISSISPYPGTNAIQSEDVVFSNTASGETYLQWWSSNSIAGSNNIAGANQSSYTLLVAQTTNDGLFGVTVTNLAGSTNDSTVLNVLVPPWITQQPTNLVVSQGNNAAFTISTFGTTNLCYQWFENGTNAIPWATTNFITLTNVVGTNAGGYSCVVTNIAGTSTSAWAWLSVNVGGIQTNGWGGTGPGSPPVSTPTVSMISPTNSSPTNPAIHLHGNSISIRATASSQYGYVTNVAFYFTGTNTGPASFRLAGNAVPGPNTQFALAWTNAIPGTNILEAVAQDYDGQTSTSSVVYVIMAVHPDFSPAPDTYLVWEENIGSTNISLSAIFQDDGQPYSFVTNINWTLTNGPEPVTIANSNSLTPTVTFYTNGQYVLNLEVDNGYATNNQTTTVTINRHPKIHFDLPTDGQIYLTGTPVVLKATAEPYDGAITGVTYFTNFVTLGSGIQSLDSAYTYLWQNLSLWTNQIFAVAADNDGLSSTATVTVVIVPPLAVQFVAPTNGQLFILSPTNIFLTAKAIDYAGWTINTVAFTNQTQSIGLGNGTPVTNSIYQFLWVDVTNGTYTVSVTASDSAENVATDQVTITNNAMPQVDIIAPTNLQTFLQVTDVTIRVSANDSDGLITNVQFYKYTVDTNNLLTNMAVAYSGSGTNDFIWKDRTTGWYPILAVATDDRGASSVSSIKVFQVTPEELSPEVEITLPTNNEVFPDGADFTITATATAGSAPITNVEFFCNGEDLGGVANPPYEMKECCLQPGSYQLMAIASDSLGSSAMSTNVQVTISPDLPTSEGFWDPALASIAYASLPLLESTIAPSCITSDGVVHIGNTLDTNGYDAVVNLTNGTNLSVGMSFPVGFSGGVETLYADGTNIYAGLYDENQITGPPPSGIYRWNYSNNQWVSVGDGLYGYEAYSGDTNAVVYAITRIDGVLYVGGDFTYGSGGNTNIAYVAKLDEVNNRWLPVGNGGFSNSPTSQNYSVKAIAGVRGEVYIGGSFLNAGGDTNANYIAKLVGNTWTNVGGGINNDVATFAVCNTNLYVGGEFLTAGDVTNANGLAIWDSTKWKGINGGVSILGLGLGHDFPEVYSLAVRGNHLFVGGEFIDVSDGPTPVPAYNIAEATWSEANQSWTWSALDLGAWYPYITSYDDFFINSLSIADGPTANSYDLYASGYFFQVGEAQTPDYVVARWRVGYPEPPGLASVTITNPVNYAIITNNPTFTSNIVITANASSYTNIQYVNFFVDRTDGSSIGQDSTPKTNSFYCNPPWQIGPGTNGVGPHILIAAATDGAGLVSKSSIVVSVKDPANTITAVSDYYTVPVNAPAVVLRVLTNDIPGTGLKISSILQPGSGLGLATVSYDRTYINYSPFPNQYGTDLFFYSITNAAGALDSAAVTVNITPLPIVQINEPRSGNGAAESGGLFATTVSGDAFEYGGTITNVSLYVNGTLFAQTNTPNFTFNWSTTGTSPDTFIAVAADANGLTNVSAPVTIIPFTTSNQVIGAINNLNPTDSGSPSFVTTGLFDLKGVAERSGTGGTVPVMYQVLLCPKGEDDSPIANLTPQADAGGLHEGSDNSGDLGNLDLTTFANGLYDLVLNVYGGGTYTNVIAHFILNTPLKIGQFSFSEQDLSLPVNGIPITVTRTYNSQNLNSDDFGYGWTFALNSMDVQLDEERMNVTVGGSQAPWSSSSGPGETVSVRSGGGWDVSLTLPNGQQTTFAFSFTGENLITGQLTSDTPTAVWTAPSWVHATLESLNSLDFRDPFYNVLNPFVNPPCWTWSRGAALPLLKIKICLVGF